MNNINVTSIELFAIVSSAVSLILGFFAIWLSLKLYKLSEESSQKLKESADKIGTSVSKLELIFDKLYSDTFTIMKDTVEGMRNHMWPISTGAGRESERIGPQMASVDELKDTLKGEIDRLIETQSAKTGNLDDMKIGVVTLVDRAIEESVQFEVNVNRQKLRTAIVDAIESAWSGGRIITPSMLEDQLPGNFDWKDIVETLFLLREERIIKIGEYNDPIEYCHQASE